MRLASYFWPQKIASFNSQYNGQVSVIESFGRLYLDAGGLMQSGPFLVKTWSRALRKLKVTEAQVAKVLMLGLGGGSFVKVIHTYFPQAQIDAVDIDPVIVEVGKKYLGLTDSPLLQIHIEDAQKYVDQAVKKQRYYDLIFVDLYQGYAIPDFVESDEFLLKLGKLKNENGSVIFNRLYFQKYKNEAMKFLDKIEKIFHHVTTAKVLANIVFLAR